MAIVTILASVALGVSLAASCGLRAFLPLFALGMAARLGFVDLGESFAWLAHGPALLALGVGVVCELLGDKVPWLNHVLDAIATPVRTVAGMLVCAAAVVDLPLWIVAILAIIVGGGVALAVHVGKSSARVTTTVASAGTAGPVHSLLEDAVCAAATVLSIMFLGVALVVAVAAVLALWFAAHAVIDRLRARRA